MEDLKEIGYEGGKTTHGDVRRAINENVAAANRNFSEVSEAATQAQAGVTELGQQVEEVSAVATKAQADVTELGQQVEEVSAVATKAQADVTVLGEQLEGVSETATEAQRGVTELGEQLEGVSATATEAQETANSAKRTAETANSTAETANSTAGAAKTAADGAAADAATAKSDAATAKSDAATAKSTAETASQTAATAKSTAETASQTAATAKSTAETAKQTAEEAKASAEGLTGDVTALRQQLEGVSATANEAQAGVTELGEQLGEVSAVATKAQEDVTELGQQLDEVSANATDATDGLHQYMTQGILTQAPFPRATAEASGSFAAVGGDMALKDGEIIPWTGWLTLVLCYTTTDSAAKVKLTGYAGPTLGKCELIGETAVAASEEPRVVRITGEHDYNPKRNGAQDACMAGSSYHVNVEVKSPNAGFTMLWAVVYESDPYGNPRRRGGSEREHICSFYGLNINFGFASDQNTRTPVVYNERTGLFEMNGLTDLTWAQMRQVEKTDEMIVSRDNAVTFSGATLISRTNTFARPGRSQTNYVNFFVEDTEVLHINNVLGFPGSGFLSGDCAKLVAILGRFNQNYYETQFTQHNAFGVQSTLETVKVYNAKWNTVLKIKNLSWDSLNYLITNAANTGAIIVTVHAGVYAKMTGGTVDDWGSLGTLASEKDVKLVSFGESGYPFLTRVLWHGYKRLENKINVATSGDIIYIHPDDRRKISAAQQDNWGELVTAASAKNITFAQSE